MLDVLDLVNRLQVKNKELDDKLIIHKGTIDWQAKEINRQKQQLANERATAEIAAETIARQDAETERLNKEIEVKDKIYQRNTELREKRIFDLIDELKTAKSEAIKEFAEMYERVIEQLLTSATIEKAYVIYECLDKFKALSYRECTKTCNEIQKKLEEMVGDDNA